MNNGKPAHHFNMRIVFKNNNNNNKKNLNCVTHRLVIRFVHFSSLSIKLFFFFFDLIDMHATDNTQATHEINRTQKDTVDAFYIIYMHILYNRY